MIFPEISLGFSLEPEIGRHPALYRSLVAKGRMA
jgi:hypothetical protein